MIDLHVHSTRSDGTFSPTKLVDYAMEKGLTAFALTDHDSVDGLEEAISYAASLKQENTDPRTVPEIIPGVELSSDYNGKEIHIVGLFLDYHNPEFSAYLAEFVAERNRRNRKMCEKLREHGIDITYEALLERFPNSVVTRAHYGRYLLEIGAVNNIREAFDRYLGDHCPCFVARKIIAPQEAVSLILNAKGIPIMAHPILYNLSDAVLDQLTKELKDAGLMGIEAMYSTYTSSDERQIRRLAEKYDLLISGGSDFHGENKPDLDLGTGYGKLYVPDEILENLKEKARTIRA